MKSGTTELLKFKSLQRRLRESIRGTVGLLELLWVGTAKNAPRGDVGKFSDEEIAIMLDWDGEAAELVNALVETRWLDRDNEHRLLVHDWQEHCPNFIKGNLAKHGREFARPTAEQDARQPARQVARHTAQNSAREGATNPCHTKTNPASTFPNPSGLRATIGRWWR